MSGDDMDRFLQRMKSDLMFELRRIQHGERPVTGQNNRESIQHFFEKHLPSSSTADDSRKSDIFSNESHTEIYRPESIVVEVQGMVERRPVSSLLQSSAFRRQLENIVWGSIQSTRYERTRRPAQSFPQPSSISTESVIAPSHEFIQERQPLSRHASIESLDSFTSAVSSFDEDFDEADGNHSQDRAAHVDDLNLQPEDRLDNAEANPETVTRQAGLSRQQEPQSESPVERVGWNEINIRQRDELVEEISELLHSHLVSSALNGRFRTTLELQIQERIRATGTDGHAVEDFVRRLPNTGVLRNDFSHLGIHPGPAVDNWDNISVTSVSAHSVPYVQTNAYLGRELQSLKIQMNEMKNMLRLTFDLQLDIQRAIRQEVAAAINSGASSAAPVSSKPVNDTHCLICLDHHTDTVLYQCGHMCVCYTCGRNLISQGHNCPVCRAPIKDVIRAFRTNAD